MIIPPKDSAIENASGTFGATEQAKWLPLLVGSNTYRVAAGNFTDVSSKLDAVQANSIQAKQLNAAYKAIDRLGPINAATKGAEGEYSIAENREGFIEYALSIIYGNDFWPRMQVASVVTRNRAVF